MAYLVTGAAGFIGMHVAMALLERGEMVVGIDNLNDYYDVGLKKARLNRLKKHKLFNFENIDIEDNEAISGIFSRQKLTGVVHLAAQAGVRYSIENPRAYIDSNIIGFLNILEACRDNSISHLVFASSSSVYGANTNMPFSVSQSVDHPQSLYAATKKSNELMAHTYAHLYGIPVTGLRFFTVYGPWGRPDMSLMLFARKIVAEEPIDIFNHGQHMRDFTYIDDICEGVIKILDRPATPNPDWSGDAPDPASSNAPYRLYNIGNNQPVELMYYIECIEKALGRKAKKNFMPLQPGDVPKTYANIDALAHDIGFRPQTKIEDGIASFIDWFKHYYKVN